jgi:rare lipoprotein A (peptidoglycan hydrolase)
VTVVPEGATIQNSAQKTEEVSANAGVKALTSTCPASREELMQWVDSQNKPFPQQGYSIQVNNVTIGTVPDRQAADEIAAQMRQAIVQVEEHPAELRPHINSSMAGAMVKDQKVFELTDDVMPVQSATMAEVATAWVNNLRHVFGAPTLDLGKTQMVAQELGETDQVIGGTASWYGPYFHGRLTATGEIFDQHALTAAHKTLPFGTVLKVRNLLNDKTVVVRINDRGPYIGNRSLDLSYAAAQCLDSEIVGVIPYEATILAPGVPEAWQADGELTAEK